MSAHFVDDSSRKDGRSEAFVQVDSNSKSDRIEMTIGGTLSMATLPRVWRKVDGTLDERGGRDVQVAVNVARLECRDTSWLALLAEMRRTIAARHGHLTIAGLAPELKALLDLALPPDPTGAHLRRPPSPGMVANVGELVARAAIQVKAIISFIGELADGFVWALLHPHRVRWQEIAVVAEKAGADAVPVALLLGFLIGVMLAFQAAEQTQRYGVRTIIPNVVAIAVTRELGPLITTLLLAGRTGSAFAAELGTMKVNQELAALRAMGLNPVRFLAVPRVASLMLVAPLLAVFCDLAGIVGGYTVMADQGFTFMHYAVQVGHALNWPDVCGGVGKTIVGGFLIGAAGCFQGINTGNGSRAVGTSTTRAVVASIILIVAVDGCFGVIYYYFGI